MNKRIVAMLWVLVALLPAHGPKSIKMDFSLDTGELSVEIRHPVKNTLRHHIKRIRVLVNDKKVIDTRYKQQTSPESHKALFPLKGIRSGDVIVIKATCNRFGGKKVRYTVK